MENSAKVSFLYPWFYIWIFKLLTLLKPSFIRVSHHLFAQVFTLLTYVNGRVTLSNVWSLHIAY